MARKRIAVVDGANISYLEKTADGKPKVSNITAVRKALEEMKFDPIIIIDASLRHEVDDPDQLEGLIESQKVRQAPAGTEADYFVLETAENEKGIVVSNDRYGKYQDRYPWIDKRRIPVMIVRGEAQLYEVKLEQHQQNGSNGQRSSGRRKEKQRR
jgi:hypothetical protein